jgi:hypothetical protein
MGSFARGAEESGRTGEKEKWFKTIRYNSL